MKCTCTYLHTGVHGRVRSFTCTWHRDVDRVVMNSGGGAFEPSLRPVRQITAEEENFRTVPFAAGPGFNAVTTRRDPVEPEPVGTYVVMVFRVTGYDPDCDGSLMARLEAVDRHGNTTGWRPTHLGLYPDTDLVVEGPEHLWRQAEYGRPSVVPGLHEEVE